MARTLEITLSLTSENTFDIAIHEPESGDFIRIPCHDSGAETTAENAQLAQEIRSWIEIMRENAAEDE